MSGERACDVYRDVDVEAVQKQLREDENLRLFHQYFYSGKFIKAVLEFFQETSVVDFGNGGDSKISEAAAQSIEICRKKLVTLYPFLETNYTQAMVSMEGSSLPSDPWRSRTIPLLVVLQQYLLGRVRKGQLTSDRGFYVAKPKPEKRLISTEATPDDNAAI